jgi:hypothetical protein
VPIAQQMTSARRAIIVRDYDSVESREIVYTGGVRFPHLEQIPGSHDYLSEILEPQK